MATTITYGATTLTPTLVVGYESTQETANVIHEILGSLTPSVTVRGMKARTGTLITLWTTPEDAEACRLLHENLGVFALASTELPQANMDYIVAGAVTIVLDEETQRVWTVSIDYQDVTE